MSIWEKLGFGGYRGFSREAEQLLQQAVELAGSFGCSQADTGHLLLAMLQQEQGAAARFLNSRHISEQAVRRQLAENRRGPAQHLDRHAMAPHHGLRPHRGAERPCLTGGAGTPALCHAGG